MWTNWLWPVCVGNRVFTLYMQILTLVASPIAKTLGEVVVSLSSTSIFLEIGSTATPALERFRPHVDACLPIVCVCGWMCCVCVWGGGGGGNPGVH